MLSTLLFVCTADAASQRPKSGDTPVRATLADGQILMGEVHTRTLRLISGTGTVDIPLADVGEVVPASGDQLGEAEGRVNVWLRNGSELRGTWADPKLAMSILVGGTEIPIDLPMNELSRFQLQGNARWPGGPVYRMRTRFGDDFLVDPARTHLVLENELGTFSPMLSECAYVAPVDDPQGLWRVQLQTGTVLLGHLQDDKVTVALPMGPAEMSVPLDQFVSLKIESWRPVAAAPVENGRFNGYGGGSTADREAVAYPPPSEVVYAAPVVTEEADDGWFSSARSRPARAAEPEPSPTPAAEWFDSAELAETKKAQE